MNEDFYRFKEVIFGLRYAYIENQRMLEQLKTYIKINGENIDKSKIYVDEIKRVNRITLNIIKKQSDISRILRYVFWQLGFAPYNNSIYTLHNENHKLYFKEELPNHRFSPKLEITNIKEFEELANEIINSKFMTLPSVFERINDIQGLSLSTYSVYLTGDISNIKSDYRLEYNPMDDTIINDQSNKSGNDLITIALYTRIPKKLIPESYREIIDENIEKCKYIHVDDVLKKGITELSITENEGYTTLKKKKVLHQYDY